MQTSPMQTAINKLQSMEDAGDLNHINMVFAETSIKGRIECEIVWEDNDWKVR